MINIQNPIVYIYFTNKKNKKIKNLKKLFSKKKVTTIECVREVLFKSIRNSKRRNKGNVTSKAYVVY